MNENVALTNAVDYKQRMRDEYRALKDKYNKLHRIIIKAEAGTLGFELNCPPHLLKEQAEVMGRYLYILEIRGEIEGVSLDDC